MSGIKEKISTAWERYCARPRQEKLLILLTASVFIHFLCALLTMIVLCVDAFRRREELKEITGVRWMVLGCIWTMVIAICRLNWAGAAATLVVWLCAVVMLYSRRYMTRPLFYTLIDVSCIMSVPCFLVAAVQRWTTPVAVELIDRPASTFLNANYYGCMTEMLILICIAHLASGVRQERQLLYYLTIAVNMVGLWFCNSFSAWFGILAGCIVLLVLHHHYYSAFFTIVGVGIAIFSFYGLQILFPRMESLGEIVQVRLDIWQTALQGVKENPLFGQGLLTYLKINPGSGNPQPHAHNMVLDMLLNFGFIGTPVLLAYLMQYYSTLRHLYLRKGRREIYQMILAVSAGWLVHGMTDVTLLWVQTGLYASIFLGGLGAEERRKTADRLPHPRRNMAVKK